jgi:hypothetical protein
MARFVAGTVVGLAVGLVSSAKAADARALNTRGYIFEVLGRTDEAIADFRRSLSQNPENQDSQQALMRLNASPLDSQAGSVR